MSQLKSRENSAAKLTAAGDSIEKRIPISSSRKFTPIATRNDQNKTKILLALNELETNKKVKKAKSIAEITPTKSKLIRKAQQRRDGSSTMMMYATPRDRSAICIPARFCKKTAGEFIFKKLMLLAWRSLRARLIVVSANSQQQQDQIVHLNMQIEVLENLRQSETDRCKQTISNCQRMQIELDVVQHDKIALCEETAVKDQKLRNLENDVKDLISKSDGLTLKLNIETGQNQCYKKEIEVIAEELTKRNHLIENQKKIIGNLQVANKSVEEQLREMRLVQTSHENNHKSLLDELKLRKEEQSEAETETLQLNNIIDNLYVTIEELERQLNDLNNKNESWRANGLQFAKLTWIVLIKAASTLLPAFKY